jgi:hypothetical protein
VAILSVVVLSGLEEIPVHASAFNLLKKWEKMDFFPSFSGDGFFLNTHSVFS